MYQSFTGTSRRPRQVNLSGRTTTNPFAAVGGSKGPQSAVANAQQDRIDRQRQRERLQASAKIQKVWRGHRSRRRTFKIWRQVWDELEHQSQPYATEEDSFRQLQRLLLFYSPRDDVRRLAWYGARQMATTGEGLPCIAGAWPQAYLRLLHACIAALKSRAWQEGELDGTDIAMQDKGHVQQLLFEILSVMAFSARRCRLSKQDAMAYYETLTATKDAPEEAMQTALLAPLQESPEAYVGLAVLLVKPLDGEMLKLLRSAVGPEALSSALRVEYRPEASPRDRLWLLGNIISLAGGSRSIAFTAVVANLMGSLADEVEFESTAFDLDNVTFDRDVLAKIPSGLPLNSFLKRNIDSLIDQDSIRNLLMRSSGEHAQLLAGFALTLLRCFPRRADDIRMWMYLGSTSQSADIAATLYFWNAMKDTGVFSTAWRDSRAVMSLLKSSTGHTDVARTQQKDDWTVILVFLELYTFLLKIMDDEEFMGADAGRRKSAVPLGDVADLVTFLKNLGFTLYFNAAELNNDAALVSRDAGSLSRHFPASSSGSSLNGPSKQTPQPSALVGLPSVTLDYLRGLVTGMLRAIYERDSRRQFLPKDHWLMTSRFDMTSFITGVVAEEESRHMVEDQDDDEYKDDDDLDDIMNDEVSPAAAIDLRDPRRAGRSAALRAQAIRERQQRQISRRRYLESVAPRLEILQNMPFFIPFETRVQIFRQFVDLDQQKRRNGVTDPDAWRANMLMSAGLPSMFGSGSNPLARHTATVRREQEFDDAYKSFYDLGDGLKEPIQITFEDKWGNPEAGIDGGGVTKEFLTSVINQAFDQSNEDLDRFFIENEAHLLYPNPTAIEDAKAYIENTLGLRGRQELETVRAEIRNLLRKYEFLGRILGKCLYEGILVDVNFAGFFLKKWSLTGGSGSAPMESGYRANINDLKELDEGLYRNLLWLKNAPTDGFESLAVTFTVDDEISVGDGTGKKKIIEHDLLPGGADKLVTPENRLIYINRMSWYRLQGQSAAQTNAFLKGLATIVQPSWLSMFNQSELANLISGAQQTAIDVDDLRANTLYGGVYVIGDDGEEHPCVQMFWEVMKELDDEDRRRVLKFVTSTPRGPLLGFGCLNPKFSIRDSGRDDGRLPSTSTCVNLLKLPVYGSKEKLRERLLVAIRSGAGFDLS
ncbi:hypothetical protein K431DRAFT_285997 [Polychaeton citri CBS 116435]|uniref:HECT-type E3 ubiquitin transferase n=1 Tax=Polychaeton citri CBS 116435 TaxID=1314669 RepID=A0A9P4ULH4_9PEZI|nr:hypothetical protein K431DRAFT_285997 [Polychaeton citri CBS 116435]